MIESITFALSALASLTGLQSSGEVTADYIDFKNKTSSEDFEYSAKCREVYDAFVKEVDAFVPISDYHKLPEILSKLFKHVFKQDNCLEFVI